jgi:ketosteroid isomerase-like protein
MLQENVEVVRRIFDGWATGDLSAGAEAFDRHVVFIISRDFPAWGVQSGVEEMREYMRDFLAQWEEATFHAQEFRSVGDTIVVDVVQRARGKASGVEGELRFFAMFKFRGRRIVRYEIVMHEHEALEAVGLSE